MVAVKGVEHPFWRLVNPFINPFGARDRAYRAEKGEARQAQRTALKKTASARKLAKQYRKDGTLT